ncbi:MAG: inorganic diphosphatase [DPANN group archaeon]|nr:inorganic diphosphatase [DPANN group archaeon]
MKVTIEITKGSFIKSSITPTKTKLEFISPIPIPFNYGFINDTQSGDSEALDIIIFGEKLKRGSKLDISASGIILFKDNNVKDYKIIASTDKKNKTYRKIITYLFFKLYATIKPLIYLIFEHKLAKSKFKGIIWFKNEIKEVKNLEKITSTL